MAAAACAAWLWQTRVDTGAVGSGGHGAAAVAPAAPLAALQPRAGAFRAADWLPVGAPEMAAHAGPGAAVAPARAATFGHVVDAICGGETARHSLLRVTEPWVADDAQRRARDDGADEGEDEDEHADADEGAGAGAGAAGGGGPGRWLEAAAGLNHAPPSMDAPRWRRRWPWRATRALRAGEPCAAWNGALANPLLTVACQTGGRAGADIARFVFTSVLMDGAGDGTADGIGDEQRLFRDVSRGLEGCRRKRGNRAGGGAAASCAYARAREARGVARLTVGGAMRAMTAGMWDAFVGVFVLRAPACARAVELPPTPRARTKRAAARAVR